jgi:hypothetical protein
MVNLNAGYHLGHLDVNRKIILKLILKKECEDMDLDHLAQDSNQRWVLLNLQALLIELRTAPLSYFSFAGEL